MTLEIKAKIAKLQHAVINGDLTAVKELEALMAVASAELFIKEELLIPVARYEKKK